jgi:hypothetical protein
LDKCNCKAPQTGNRVAGEKICSYTCECEDNCGKKYTKTIKVSAGSGGSAKCKGQWEDLWNPNLNTRTGFEDFDINTDGTWDKVFNGDFVDAIND